MNYPCNNLIFRIEAQIYHDSVHGRNESLVNKKQSTFRTALFAQTEGLATLYNKDRKSVV